MARRENFTVNTSVMRQLRQAGPVKQEAFLRAAAFAILADIISSFNTSPPGREYQSETGVIHVASQPGYPPNIDTGTLANSMKVTPDGKLRYLIHDQTDYGLSLEYGRGRVLPRPFVVPVFDRWRASEFVRLAVAMGVGK